MAKNKQKTRFKKLKFLAKLAAVGTFVGSGFSLSQVWQNTLEAQEKTRTTTTPITDLNKENTAFIVFAGEAGRIHLACAINDKIKAPIFVAGCNPEAEKTLNSKFKNASYNIEFGFESYNTSQNAMEAVKWLKDKPHITNVVLVTADYHSTRSYETFKREALNNEILDNVEIQIATLNLNNTDQDEKSDLLKRFVINFPAINFCVREYEEYCFDHSIPLWTL